MPIKVERNVTRDQIWARIFLSGASGSGKTRGALELASRLFDGSLPVALINTEPNRGKLYADRFKLEALIDVEGSYHPERFIEAIDAAEQIVPGGIVILDSATHEWYGTDGITQLASRFGDWAKARPLHQKFVDRIQVAQLHVIVCCRAKMKYEQVEVEENGRTKQKVVVLGVGPMQDADFQYEFSLAGQIDRATHEVEWGGHIDALEGTTTTLVGEDADEVAKTVTDWLSTGTPIQRLFAAEDEVTELGVSLASEGISSEVIEAQFAKVRTDKGELRLDYVQRNLAASKERIAKGIKPKAVAAKEAPAAAEGAADGGGAPAPAEEPQEALAT